MIVVAGEALVDLIVAPDGALRPALGGGPFNAARAIARLGGASAYLGHVSDDVFGRQIRAALVADGVATALVRPTTLPTTLALAELGADGSASYHFYTEATAGLALSTADVALPLPAAATALHVGTLGLAFEPSASAVELLAARVAAGVLLFVDPNCRPAAIADPAGYRARLERVLARADVVKVSVEDLAFLYPGTVDEAAGRVLAQGARVVLVTDGPRGARVRTRRGTTDVTTAPARVVDTVGAGDAFGAGFLAWWTLGGHGRGELQDDDLLVRATRFACEVARLTCERAGATSPTAAEVVAFR